VSVTIHFEPPLVKIKHEADEFEREILDFNPLWDRIAPLMAEVELERWASDGFGSWPPLAESTIRQKGHGDILIDTYALLESLADPGQAVKHQDAQSMEYGTDIDYAHWHQDGGYKPGRPPQRVILDVPDAVMPRFEAAAVEFVNEVAARSFGA
jgi:phage gpG-like protein